MVGLFLLEGLYVLISLMTKKISNIFQILLIPPNMVFQVSLITQNLVCQVFDQTEFIDTIQLPCSSGFLSHVCKKKKIY